jgi:hypothetical protein
VPPIGLQDQPLIQAIEKLTGVIINASSGNTSTVGVAPRKTMTERARYAASVEARNLEEAKHNI